VRTVVDRNRGLLVGQQPQPAGSRLPGRETILAQSP